MSVLAAHDFVHPADSRRLARGAAAEPKVGFLRRIYDASMRWRERQANEDIARYIEQSGGRLTDEIERGIMRRLTRNWNLCP